MEIDHFPFFFLPKYFHTLESSGRVFRARMFESKNWISTVMSGRSSQTRKHCLHTSQMLTPSHFVNVCRRQHSD